jgi:hypothetical protein
MKIAIGILIAIMLVLAWQLNAAMTTNRAQQEQIQQLTVSLADKSKRENLELQEKCAAQAQKMFRQLGWEDNDPKSGSIALYQSHYNAKANRCFLTVDSTSGLSKGGVFKNRFLIDAYEQKGYAEFNQMFYKGIKDAKAWSDSSMHCMLMPSSPNQHPCKSEEEYLAFVAGYIE